MNKLQQAKEIQELLWDLTHKIMSGEMTKEEAQSQINESPLVKDWPEPQKNLLLDGLSQVSTIATEDIDRPHPSVPAEPQRGAGSPSSIKANDATAPQTAPSASGSNEKRSSIFYYQVALAAVVLLAVLFAIYPGPGGGGVPTPPKPPCLGCDGDGFYYVKRDKRFPCNEPPKGMHPTSNADSCSPSNWLENRTVATNLDLVAIGLRTEMKNNSPFFLHATLGDASADIIIDEVSSNSGKPIIKVYPLKGTLPEVEALKNGIENFFSQEQHKYDLNQYILDTWSKQNVDDCLVNELKKITSLQINPISNKINKDEPALYIVSEFPDILSDTYSGSCSYVKDKNVIICDSNYLYSIGVFTDKLLNALESSSRLDPDSLEKSQNLFKDAFEKNATSSTSWTKLSEYCSSHKMNISIATWYSLVSFTIYHEIGHKHDTTQYEKNENNISSTQDTDEKHNLYCATQKELETWVAPEKFADTFGIDHFLLSKEPFTIEINKTELDGNKLSLDDFVPAIVLYVLFIEENGFDSKYGTTMGRIKNLAEQIKNVDPLLYSQILGLGEFMIQMRNDERCALCDQPEKIQSCQCDEETQNSTHTKLDSARDWLSKQYEVSPITTQSENQKIVESFYVYDKSKKNVAMVLSRKCVNLPTSAYNKDTELSYKEQLSKGQLIPIGGLLVGSDSPKAFTDGLADELFRWHQATPR